MACAEITNDIMETKGGLGMTNFEHDSNWLNVYQYEIPGIHNELSYQTDLMLMKHLWESGALRDDTYQLWLLKGAEKRGFNIPKDALAEEAKGLV